MDHGFDDTHSYGEEHPAIAAARHTAEQFAAVRARHAPPSTLVPGYRILREIHRGGQGVVYEAKQLGTGRNVAIKVMHEGRFIGPRARERFQQEVRLLARLKHPNIVTIHDSGVVDGGHYFVMDYIQGEPLDAHIARTAPSVEDTLRLFLRICEAVNAAHLRGVLHRDLKPSNIRIDEQGEPHILDFGLAKYVAENDDATRAKEMTITGQFVGSLPWASPEQVDGAPESIDLRTDVYSLGVVLYQALTGQFPYMVMGKMREVVNRILDAEPVGPSRRSKEIDHEVETIVLKCLAKNPERRYQSAGELARDVQRYLANEAIEAKRDSTLYVLRKRLRRYRAAVVGGAAFVLLLAISSAVGWSLYAQSQRNLWKSYMAQARATQTTGRAGQRFDALAPRTAYVYRPVSLSMLALLRQATPREPGRGKPTRAPA